MNNQALASVLGLIYGLSELGLSLGRRAKSGESSLKDQGSLRLLWVVIAVSVAMAYSVARRRPAADMGNSAALRFLGIGIFVAGLSIRWYAIVYLGRFFTVNVAIAADHQLIDTRCV